MANVMQCLNSSTPATNYGNIYNVHKYNSPSICKYFNGFRADSKISLTAMHRTFSFGRALEPAWRKSAHLSTVKCSQSTGSSTIEKVQEIIAQQLSVDTAIVQPHTKFSDLGADSLDTVEIVMSIEEEFGVSIPEESAESISTVQQVADLIEEQITVTV